MPKSKREQPSPPPKRSNYLVWIIAGIVGLLVVMSMCSNSASDRAGDRGSRPATATTTKRAAAEQPWKLIPGDGTHQMGGMDGKNWGTWEATATGDCQWSIRAVRSYAGGQVLDEGTAAAGQSVRVNIQPDGKVSATSGMIDGDHRIVFMTSGCGAWRFVS